MWGNDGYVLMSSKDNNCGVMSAPTYKYWLVKNSWSNMWGNDGYVLMSAKDNNCDVMSAPTYVLIDGKRQYNINARRKRETNEDPRCQPFTFETGKKRLTHPRNVGEQDNKPGEGTYTSNTTCFTTIEAEEGQVIELTFVDVFEIEYSADCVNDYLEIRNGKFGYARPEYRYCGKGFPPQVTSTGPYLWLKFKSDDIIEYAGFTIEVNFQPKIGSRAIDGSCYITKSGNSGTIDGTSTSSDLQKCRAATPGPLDVQWKIEAEPGTQIYLNITKFQLANPNNCTRNTVQIFGAKPNFEHLLGEYCSSVAKSLWTEEGKKIPGPVNIMYIRLYTIDRRSNFSAIYTQFRTADACDADTEFDCKDSTCIASSLRCDEIAHCRLKNDEDPVECKGEAQSLVRDKDTRNILIVFSLILSGMVAVFLFKCIRKLYNDQKLINEYKSQARDDLNKTASQLTLDPKPSRCRESPSLEHHNHSNEGNRHTHQQRSTSMESDLLRMRVDDDSWPETQPFVEDSRHKSRPTRDLGWNEELLSAMEDSRHKSRPLRDLGWNEELLREKGKEEKNRDLSTLVQEIQDTGCQTRDSLFQMDPILPTTNAPGSKSGSNSRAGSGVSPRTPTPRLTVELLRQATAQESTSQADGRPLSTETTKSAPDVIQIY
ncbi:neuropilin and tolloid-like protein 1 [Cydia fagiglandana]|uniref:neuropilin and tolloid-like protein 1 n=1 Tax=Cydia fagiglandana TaxID=1458189 RepID=UPI002FEE1851